MGGAGGASYLCRSGACRKGRPAGATKDVEIMVGSSGERTRRDLRLLVLWLLPLCRAKGSGTMVCGFGERRKGSSGGSVFASVDSLWLTMLPLVSSLCRYQ